MSRVRHMTAIDLHCDKGSSRAARYPRNVLCYRASLARRRDFFGQPYADRSHWYSNRTDHMLTKNPWGVLDGLGGLVYICLEPEPKMEILPYFFRP